MHIPPQCTLRNEKSFSLFETVIAIGMLAVVFLYINGIQGQVVYSLEYGQNLSRGLWLARGILARIDYEWATRDLSELDMSIKESKITDDFWGEDAGKTYMEFTYRLDISEWKLPIQEIFDMGGSGEGGEGMIEQVFGGHMMKIAEVEVFWPEGARRASTQLSLLLVNQRAVDNFRKRFQKSQSATTSSKSTKTTSKSSATSEPSSSSSQEQP